MANKRQRLSDKEKTEIRELHSLDPVKYTKYKLAVMYGVTWGTIHYTIDEPARLKNNELTKQRNAKARKESK